MSEPIIKVDQLRVIYNQGKSNEIRSLDGVDLEIFPQEYVIIYGPSGCGKSTLLYSIAGLQSPTYGEVMMDGKKLTAMTKKEKVKLHQTGAGMIFQAFYLIPSLKVLDNICLPKVFCGEDPEERKKEGMRLLHRFSIAEQSDKFPGQLSGGQKQRVAIARSLINNPQIILADEPVGNLDSESAQNVLEILKDLNETDKKTIILVTHNNEHLHYADRVIHMKDGKITGIEVNREKRPKDVIRRELTSEPVEISNELKILMRTFKNLSSQQIGVLLVPFKAKQLLSHILSELTEEQLRMAENILKEFLFKNIELGAMEKKLDLNFEDGGADWNKQRAKSFSKRINGIMEQVDILKNNPETAYIALADYLSGIFGVEVDQETKMKFRSFLKLRNENKIDRFGLQQRLDASRVLGGLGLYKSTAEKIIREVEVIMLLKYSE